MPNILHRYNCGHSEYKPDHVSAYFGGSKRTSIEHDFPCSKCRSSDVAEPTTPVDKYSVIRWHAVRETEKAVLVDIETPNGAVNNIWFPKSKINGKELDPKFVSFKLKEKLG